MEGDRDEQIREPKMKKRRKKQLKMFPFDFCGTDWEKDHFFSAEPDNKFEIETLKKLFDFKNINF